MRTYDEDDAKKEIEQDHVEPWMIECIKKNPDYNCWGNSEDYMRKKEEGWDSQQEIHSISELWELNDYNELVNFHFQTHRKGHECPDCEGIGYNPKTMELYMSWYGKIYGKPSWMYQLTEVEVLALAKAGRLSQCGVKACYDDEKKAWFSLGKDGKEEIPAPKMPSPEAVNLFFKTDCIGHDSINCWVCVGARAESLGVYGDCPTCSGRGAVFDEPASHLELQMWILHPRKGCSRGLLLTQVNQEDLPRIYEYLKEAAARNAQRFSRL